MSSDHYHTHKEVLCWDCNNLIKNIYENALVWREIRPAKWSGLFTFEKTVIVAVLIRPA